MLEKKQAECALMAYGTSSAGKTYTIEAGLPEHAKPLFTKCKGLQPEAGFSCRAAKEILGFCQGL